VEGFDTKLEEEPHEVLRDCVACSF